MTAADRVRAALDAHDPDAAGNAADWTEGDIRALLADRDRLHRELTRVENVLIERTTERDTIAEERTQALNAVVELDQRTARALAALQNAEFTGVDPTVDEAIMILRGDR